MKMLRETERVALWEDGGQYLVTRCPEGPEGRFVLWHDNDRERAEREFARLDAEEVGRGSREESDE